MKTNILRSVIAGCVLLTCGSSYAEVLDKVIVVVNDEVITQREFDRVFSQIKQGYEGNFQGAELDERLEGAKKALIEQIINTKIAISYAKKEKIEVNEETLQARVGEIKKYYGDEETFLKALDERGSNLTEFKREISDQIMAQQVVEMEVASKVVVTPSEINELFEKNREKFTTPLGVQVKSIMIRKSESEDDDRAKIDGIRARALQGEDFAELAKEVSEGPFAAEGGEMGVVVQGQLRDEIDDILFGTPKGDVTDIVETDVGYHIFMIEDIKQPRNLELDEVSDFLRGEIFKGKFEFELKNWLDEKRKNAYIAYK